MIKIIIIIIIIVILCNCLTKKNIENFGFPYWNIGTRFYPPYDIRGYISNMYPFIYITPYFYTTNGNYIYNNDLSNKIKKTLY